MFEMQEISKIKLVEQTAPTWGIFRVQEFTDIILKIVNTRKIELENTQTTRNSLKLLNLKLLLWEKFSPPILFRNHMEGLYLENENAKFINRMNVEELTKLLEKNKELAIFYSKDYERKINKIDQKPNLYTQEIIKTEIAQISLFLKYFNFESFDDKNGNIIQESLYLEFCVFWKGFWNFIYLEICKDKINLHRFLYNNTLLEYKGLGHYFMSFIKILAIKLDLSIVLQSTSQAIIFYEKEGFVEIENGKMIWQNQPIIKLK